jgi:signal transduction histidine kinase
MPSSEGDRPASGGEILSESDALRRMYRITADHERSYETKVRDLLETGRAYLGVEAGFLTEISDGRQLIVEASGEHELLQPGESCPLSKSYCRKTIEQKEPLTVQHAKVEGWEDDAAYELFGLESYIGANVLVDGDLYGTFCFADTDPREEPFTDSEEMFVELMAEWVSYELFQKRATNRIAEQRDQLEKFTKVVSHDLRNPLSVAQGYLDLAEETGDPEHFERSRNALQRMESLIDDLLVLAHEGVEISDTETIELSELVTTCWSFVATDGATLSVETDMHIKGDGSRLGQLFENLFRNAIEHGGSDVTIRIGELTDCEGIYVEDDGRGIPPENREEVFDDGYTTKEDGTGFGLAIVKQITDAHGWDVRITESAEGGARFEFTGVSVVEG